MVSDGTTTVNNVVLNHYLDLGMTTEELVLYLLVKQENGTEVVMPDTGEVAKKMGLSSKQVFELFHQLITKNLMQIATQVVNGRQVDGYDFAPLFEKLGTLLAGTQQSPTTEPQSAVAEQRSVDMLTRQGLFGNLENEFGRTLSPIEMETVSQWLDIDHYPIDMINLALKEAVLSQVYNLKYMDRILMNWEKKNLRTADQVEADKRQNDRTKKETGNNGYSGPEIPLINLTE